MSLYCSDRATEEAIHKLAPQLEAEQSVPLYVLEICCSYSVYLSPPLCMSVLLGKNNNISYVSLPSKQSESLESTKVTPPELLTLPPNQIIR